MIVCKKIIILKKNSLQELINNDDSESKIITFCNDVIEGETPRFNESNDFK